MDFLTLIHIIIAVVLILLVLVQDSKGAMGSTFGGGGGGSQTLFGSTGMDNVLTKSTKITVVFFALTCILLTRLSSQNRDSVLDVEGQRPTQPVPTQQQPSPAETTTSDEEAPSEDASEESSAEGVSTTNNQGLETQVKQVQGLDALEVQPDAPTEDSAPPTD